MLKHGFPLILGLSLSLPVFSLTGKNQTPDATAGSKLVSPAPEGLSLGSHEFERLYGPGVFNMNALGNTIVGVYHQRESMTGIRFLSTMTGKPQSIRFFLASGIGYSEGNGGTIRIRLLPDDNTGEHLPDLARKPLAETVFNPNLPGNREKKGYFPLVKLDQVNARIESGKLYHLLFDNVDPNPNKNFSSINNAVTIAANGRPSRWLNTRDWATLFATRSTKAENRGPFTWTNLTETGSSGNYFSPILQINLDDGQSQGVSDMESGSVDPQRVFIATRNRPIRERFKPVSDKLISGLSFAAGASVQGTLTWRILHGETQLASGKIQQKEANYHPIKSNTGILLASMTWYDIPLANPVKFQAGQTYDIEFTPEGKSEWTFADHTNGALSGFSWPAAFTESQAQHFRNGHWLDAYHWNYGRSATGSNWPVVLHLAPR